MELKIKIENESVYKEQMKAFGRVEGAIRKDEGTGKLTFKAFNRRPIKRVKVRRIAELDNGWVGVSEKLVITRAAYEKRVGVERIKVHGSFPKRYGTTTVMGLMEEHTSDAKNALLDWDLNRLGF